MPWDPADNTAAGSAAIASLVDNSGGTPSDTIADAGATYAEAVVANTAASQVAKINAILQVLRDNELIVQ